jgi:hypothetical protein
MSVTKLARATEPLPGLETEADGFDHLDRASWRMVVHSEAPNLKKWFHGLVLSLSKGSPLDASWPSRWQRLAKTSTTSATATFTNYIIQDRDQDVKGFCRC